MYCLDRDGRFIAANPALLEMVGARSIKELQTSDDVPEPLANRRELVEHVAGVDRLPALETTWQTVEGEEIVVRITPVRRLDVDGKLDGVDATVEDVTERARKDKALRHALLEAEESQRARASFLSNLSHEVRTPLTAIIGFSSILGRELDGESARHARLVEESGRRLVDTFDAVLTFANLESNDLEFNFEQVDLAEVVRQVADGFLLRATNKGIELTFDDHSGSASVHTDPEAFAIALRSILSNAIKFTEEDGEVRISMRREDDDLIVEVADTGIGIDPQFLPYVFEPFRQESDGVRRTHSGTGIGLSVAHRIAQSIGVQIQVSSVRASGTTFTIRLPSTSSDQPTVPVGTAARAPG